MQEFRDNQNNLYETYSAAFETRVISFTPGNPWTPKEENMDSDHVIGIPNKWDVTLGARGEIIMQVGMPFFDGDGIDFAVLETGSSTIAGCLDEAFAVSISNDLDILYDIGTSNGGHTVFDIGGKAPQGMTFRYIKVTDLWNITNVSLL